MQLPQKSFNIATIVLNYSNLFILIDFFEHKFYVFPKRTAKTLIHLKKLCNCLCVIFRFIHWVYPHKCVSGTTHMDKIKVCFRKSIHFRTEEASVGKENLVLLFPSYTTQ